MEIQRHSSLRPQKPSAQPQQSTSQPMLAAGMPPHPDLPSEPIGIVIRGRTYSPNTPQYQAFQLYQAGYKPQEIRRIVKLQSHGRGWGSLFRAFRKGDVIEGYHF